MSHYLREPLYKGRSLDQQWLNNIVSSHDLMCGCSTPFKHLKDILKCRGDTDGEEEDKDHGTSLVPEDGFDAGDLETLFEEPFTEDDSR